jgi:hypothetical protein
LQESAPVLPPVAPLAPYSVPLAGEEPVTTPEDISPENSPLEVPIPEPIARNETFVPSDPKEVGADVLGPAIAIPGAAVIGTALFLFFYLRRKKEKKQEGDKATEMYSVIAGQSGTEPGTYAMIPGQQGGTGSYSAVPLDGSASTVGGDAFQGINPTAIQPSEIDKRMQIPYKSLLFLREIGAGSYGKVFQG